VSEPEKIDVMAVVIDLAARARQRIDDTDARARRERRDRLQLEERKRSAARDPRVGVPQSPDLIGRAIRPGTGRAAQVVAEVYRFSRGDEARTATVWLIGQPGTGKTTAAIRAILDHEASHHSAAYLRAPILPGVRNYATAELYDRARRVDLLVLDEIGTEAEAKVITELVCERHDNGRVTICVGNLDPQQCVERYSLMTDARVRSRMAQLRRLGCPPVRVIRDRDFREGETP
jgi:DNA replication protein DnaC